MASTGSCIGSDESPISANATQPACGCNASREPGDLGVGTLTMRGPRGLTDRDQVPSARGIAGLALNSPIEIEAEVILSPD